MKITNLFYIIYFMVFNKMYFKKNLCHGLKVTIIVLTSVNVATADEGKLESEYKAPIALSRRAGLCLEAKYLNSLPGTGMFEAEENDPWQTLRQISNWWSVLYGYSLFDTGSPAPVINDIFDDSTREDVIIATCQKELPNLIKSIRNLESNIYAKNWQTARVVNEPNSAIPKSGDKYLLRDEASWCVAAIDLGIEELNGYSSPETYFGIDIETDDGKKRLARFKTLFLQQRNYWQKRYETIQKTNKLTTEGIQSSVFDHVRKKLWRGDIDDQSNLEVTRRFLLQETNFCAYKSKALDKK